MQEGRVQLALLIGWPQIIKQLRGITDKRTAKKFLRSNGVPICYDKLSLRPVVNDTEFDALWERLKKKN
jgi:hypothetical protein